MHTRLRRFIARFCSMLLLVVAVTLNAAPSNAADTPFENLVERHFGVWWNNKFPFEYTIDNTFSDKEKTAIENAFMTWGDAGSGSRLRFKRIPYDSQTLTPLNGDKLVVGQVSDVVLVTKQDASGLDGHYRSVLQGCERAVAFPICESPDGPRLCPLTEKGRIIGGSIIFRSNPGFELGSCLPGIWSVNPTKLNPWPQWDVESVALHEIGHVLGLQHPINVKSDEEEETIMGRIDSNDVVRELYVSDIAAVNRLYAHPEISPTEPPTGPPGTTFTLQGQGFSPLHTATVNVRRDGSLPQVLQRTTIAADGRFTMATASQEPGLYTWWASDDGSGFVTMSSKYTVTSAIPVTTGAVSGTVHSGSTTGLPLSGVYVTCSGKSTTTGSDGRFYITGVSSGNQEVSFSKAGYQSYTKAIYIAPAQSIDVGDRWLVPVAAQPSPTATPDLAVHALSIHKSDGGSTHKLYLAPGDKFTIDVEIRNRGTVKATKAFKINYLLSDDDRIESSDILIGTDDNIRQNIDVNSIYHDTKRDIVAPFTPGTYFIGASVRSPEDINNLNDYSRGDDERAKIIVSIPNRSPEGWLDSASCELISGWARDPNTTSAIQVRVYADGPAGTGTLLGSTTADAYRSDLPFDDKSHGFAFVTPAPLKDGRSHTIYAYGIDSAGGVNPLLSGCPKTIACVPQTGSATGKLIESSPMGPAIEGAKVMCGALTTATASDGTFTLTGLPPGANYFTFSKTGYEPYSTMISVTVGQVTDMGLKYLVPIAKTGPWVQKKDFESTQVTREVISFSVGGKGYVGTGSSVPLTELWQFDPVNNSWLRKNDLPGFNFQSPSFVIGQKAYVVSGNQLWEYSPSGDTWMRKRDVPGEDKKACFGLAIGEKGYIGGGYYNGRKLWEYDPVNDAWVQKQDHPALSSIQEDVGGVTFTVGNKGYVTGTNFYGIWEYEPVAETWQNRANLNAAYGQGFALAGKGYIFNAVGELYEYDPQTNIITSKPAFPGQKMCYPAGFSINGKGYIGMGGIFENNTCSLSVTKQFWEYTDTANATTVSLYVNPAVITEADAMVTYTATLTNPAQGDVTVHLDNGQTLTIADGHTTATIDYNFANMNDVYIGPKSSSVSIIDASGGNFQQLLIDGSPTTVYIMDTVDYTTVSLSVNQQFFTESSAFVTYTAALTSVAHGDVTVQLSNGSTITIADGTPTGTVDVYVPLGGYSVAIVGASGGNFEYLMVDPTPATVQ